MKPRCLETRLAPDGLSKWRRYRYPDGRTFKTIEVPIEVWNGINKQGNATVHDRAAGWLRARKRDELRERARQLHDEGWKALAIASELSKPVRTVQRWVTGL